MPGTDVLDAPLNLVRDLAPLTAGGHIWSLGIGPAGEACFLVGAAVPRYWSSLDSATLVTATGISARRTVLGPVDDVWQYVQPLPAGGALLARSWRSGKDNGAVYGPDGMRLATFSLGDGIEDVQTSASGRIWVSYMDEGAASGAETGLTCFDTQGRKRWDFDIYGSLPRIDGCYALNVAGDTAWAYYFSSFTLLRVGPDGATSHWETGASGAKAVAVGERSVLLYGSYDRRPEPECHLGDFGAGRLTNLRRCRLLLPSGEPFRPGDRLTVTGRGSVLHVINGTVWYQVDVNTLR